MIDRINQSFVSTWIIVDDAEQRARAGDPFAATLAENWKFPMDIMFLSPEGKLLSKLNSFQDLRDAHPDVGHPDEGRGKSRPHGDVFFQHVDKHFPLHVSGDSTR